MIFGLSYLDLIIIALYMGVIIYIGLRAMKKIKNTEDYFMGGRQFSKIVQIFSAFGQATSADTGPSVATNVRNNGASGIWAALMMLFVTPAYWFAGVWYRRMRVSTLGDFFTERYQSQYLGGFYAILASISMVVLLSVGYVSITKTIMVMTPKAQSELTVDEQEEYRQAQYLDELEARDYSLLSADEKAEMHELQLLKPSKAFSHINKNAFIWLVALLVIAYSVMGGLEAAFKSDLIQGFFIILLSILLLPFAINQINVIYGGETYMDAFKTIHEQLPASFFEIFGSPHTVDFTWYYILAISLLAMFNVMVGPNQLVATGSSKNEYVARYGFTFGTYLKRLTIVLWGVTSLAVVLLFGSAINDPDLLWGHATYELLGPLNLGLIGLMIASLMAALMSTADMIMLTVSGLLTHNIYKPFFPNKSESHYVLFGRISGSLVVIGAAVMVMNADSILNALKENWEFNVMLAPGFWLGIMWRKTNRRAIWATMLITSILFYGIPLIISNVGYIRTNEALLKQTEEVIIERTYVANQGDVRLRKQEITSWQAQSNATVIPANLEVGQVFSKQYRQPSRAIFWSKGIAKNKETGALIGQGTIKITMLMYDFLGFDLSKNPYALNETIKVLTKLTIPFLIAILFSLFSKQTTEEKAALDRFYVKMKTPVTGDVVFDESELKRSYKNPNRFDHKLMLPGTNWEFCKWNGVDSRGFIVSVGMIFVILFLLWFFVNIGS